MNKIFFSSLLSGLLVACTPKAVLMVYQTDPLVKVIHTDTAFTDRPDTVFVARGENAVFQFVVKSKSPVTSLKADVDVANLGKVRIGWIHDVLSTNPVKDCPDVILPVDSMYPDPIIDDAEENLEDAKSHKTLLVDIAIPRDASPGIYRGKLIVSALKEGKRVKVSKTFTIKIYPVTLPEKQGLIVVNHMGDFNAMNNGKQVEAFSDRWFSLMQKVVETAAEYGQNCWLSPVRPDIVPDSEGTDFHLDFGRFDRVMDFLQQHGNMRYFCNSYMGGRPSDEQWNDAFRFSMTEVKDGQIYNENVAYDDPRLKSYIERYYGQIEAHLREKGWLGCCYQHIADEPALKGTDSQKSWSYVANLVKKAAPSLRTIDACYELVENQDVSVVLLADNIAQMPPVPEGSERWMYTCCAPQGNFANRFVAQPLLKTRILHWINYKYKACGFLHWGLSRWNFCPNPLSDVTPRGYSWSGGDCYILYPAYEKVYPSIRAGAMRDGIHDYDLLRMVEARDAEKAKEFADRIIQGPDKYNLDTRHFQLVHRQMLEYLSNGAK